MIWTCDKCGKVLVLSIIKPSTSISNHYRICVLNMKYSENWHKSIAKAKLGEKNPQWKGDDVGYKSLHEYMRSHLQVPKVCDNCHKDKPLDLANKSGEYKREKSDWEWLCRRCHLISDKRIEHLHWCNRKENQKYKWHEGKTSGKSTWK